MCSLRVYLSARTNGSALHLRSNFVEATHETMGSNHAFPPPLPPQLGHICHTDQVVHECNLDEVSPYTLSAHHGQQARQGYSNTPESDAIQSSSSFSFCNNQSYPSTIHWGVSVAQQHLSIMRRLSHRIYITLLCIHHELSRQSANAHCGRSGDQRFAQVNP